MSNWHPRPKTKDQVHQRSIPVKTPPPLAIPAKIVNVVTGETVDTFPSRSAAQKILKKLISNLPAGAPHTYEIQDDL